jgi:hypothetical protein
MATLVHSDVYVALVDAGVSPDRAGVVAPADPRVPTPNRADIVTMLQAVLLKLDGLDKRIQALEQRFAPLP